MKYAVERRRDSMGRYNFMIKIDKNIPKNKLVYTGWISDGGHEYIAVTPGGEHESQRFAYLTDAIAAVELAIGKVLEEGGVCDKAELVKSVKHFDNI